MRTADVDSQFKHIFAEIIRDKNEAHRMEQEMMQDRKRDEQYSEFWANTCFEAEIPWMELESASTPDEYAAIGQKLQEMYEADKDCAL